MVCRRLGLAAVLAAMLPLATAQAQDYGLKDAQATPASIHHVRSGGHWEQGNQEGFYRVVVASGGFEHVIARLFIQWIELDQDAREYKVVRTLEVKEIGLAAGVAIAPKFAGPGNWIMPVTITRRDGKRESRTITVRPEGRYSVK